MKNQSNTTIEKSNFFLTEKSFTKRTATKHFFGEMRTTPSIETFLGWIMGDIVMEEEKKETKRLRLLEIIASWNSPKGNECFRGEFNEKQYDKYIDYISSNMDYIPKNKVSVKLRTIYPI